MSELEKVEDANEAAILTDAAIPINLNGRELTAKAPSERDFTELDGWIRGRYIKLARSSSEGLDKRERDEITGVAIKTAMGIFWWDEDGRRVFNTVDGLARVAWMMIRKSHRDITYEWCQDCLNKEHNLDEVIRVFEYFNNLAESIKGNGEAGSSEAGSSTGKN